MDWESRDIKIIELERLIQEFKDKFKQRTSSVDSFLTITEIELMWAELQNNTTKICSDMVRELMSEVDEREIINKKKESTNKEG